MSRIKFLSGSEVAGNNGSAADGAYNSSTRSINVSETAQPRFGDVPESLVDVINLAVGTHYYPDVNGFCNFGFNNTLCIDGILIADAATTIILTIEGTNDEAITNFKNVTEIFDRNDNQRVTNLTVNDATLLYGLQCEKPAYRYYRLKVEVQGSNGNTVTGKMLRKAE